uniref:TonB-dependent receptor n=1 Tax=Sphingobium estronivorans TaxID=1577690 RepID=UPI0012392943
MMTPRFIAILLSSTAFISQAAIAQELTAPAAAGGGVEDIVVTAQRREENLQRVPIAVTALTAKAIEQRRIMDVADLNNLAPGLNVSTTSGASPIITVRGLNGGGVVLPGIDGPIALYIDGIYIARTVGSLFDLAEIERIEVLRGPQGTLFGRNATAGAISFITKGPTGEWGLKQDFSVGNNDYFRTRTTLNLPEWNGLSASVTYMHIEQDGPVRNLQNSAYDFSAVTNGRIGVIRSARTLGLKNEEGVQVAVRYEPSSDIKFCPSSEHLA